jgi:AP2 domain
MSRNTDNNWTIGNYKTNRYREVVDLDEEDDYYEVEIFGDGKYHIGQIDIEFLDRFTERTWGALKIGNNFYMNCGATKKFPDEQYFHRLVLPEADIVDHKNRNGLDNRKKNLRDGSGGVNNNNLSLYDNNISGTNGVSFHTGGKYWCARWYENGVQQYKYFSIKKYGSDEKAKQKAIEHRKAMNEITGSTNGE